MPKNYTWDQIRSQVRAFRTSNQAASSSLSFAVIKDFHIDARKQQIYFLANSYNCDGCLSRQLTLYQVSYLDNLNREETSSELFEDKITCECCKYISWLSQQPVLQWKAVFDEYITAGEDTVVSDGTPAYEKKQRMTATTQPIQGVTQYQCCDDIVMLTYNDAVYCSRSGKIPTLVPQRPPPRSQTYFPSPEFLPSSPSSSPSSQTLHTDKCSPQKTISNTATPSIQRNPSKRCVRLDPKLGGKDNDLIAFIRDRDIWVSTLDGYEIQLTNCASQTEGPNLSCGTAEYVMQEEFHRYTGYYWGPPTHDGKNRILYSETSEDSVDTILITKPSILKSSSGESMRYPRAGRANARSELCIVEFGPVQENIVLIKKLWNNSLSKQFPWVEYIPRFGWLPDGESIWVQILSRDQKKSMVIRILTMQFTVDKTEDDNNDHVPIEVLWEETSHAWVNVSDAYYFLKKPSKSGKLEFIWSSELSGYRHLYLVTKDKVDGAIRRRQLTFGEWCISDYPIYVDEERQLVYLMAKKDTPVELHLYVVHFGGEDVTSIERLTDLGFSHMATVDSSANIVIDCFSNLHHPPCIAIRYLEFHTNSRLPRVASDKSTLLFPISTTGLDIDLAQDPPADQTYNVYAYQLLASSNPSVSPLSNLSLTAAIESGETRNAKLQPTLHRGEIFSFTNIHGVELYGYLYKPRNYQPGHSYPTILHIYGGPKTQMVTNEYKVPRIQRYLMSIYFGFAVVVIDGRGSSDRGLEFESYISGRLGLVEIEDQVSGLQYIHDAKIGAEPTADNRLESVVDMARVAITGWSYGGYLSLMGLAQRPDVFKIAIAGAPVTQWELYNSAYTERYMGLPSENSKLYNDSSVLNWIDRFPDSEHRLLIAHGLIDENVHFTNTELLVSNLVKHNKPHYLQVYPTEKHGLRHASVNEHFETLMFFWLLNYL